jgi:hypothetical protein
MPTMRWLAVIDRLNVLEGMWLITDGQSRKGGARRTWRFATQESFSATDGGFPVRAVSVRARDGKTPMQLMNS